MIENNQTKSKESKRGGAGRGQGRKAGSATKKTRDIADRAAAEGVTPLEFMLQVMRTEPDISLDPKIYASAMEMRFEAAKAAAPYIHPRLAAIEHTGEGGGPIDHSLTVTFEEKREDV
jgi:hypothetical protein